MQNIRDASDNISECINEDFHSSESGIDLHNLRWTGRRNVAIKLWFKMRTIVGHAIAIEKRALLLRATGLSRIYRALKHGEGESVCPPFCSANVNAARRIEPEEFKLHDLRFSADVSHPPTFPCPLPSSSLLFGVNIFCDCPREYRIHVYHNLCRDAGTKMEQLSNFATSRLTNVIVSSFFPLFRLIFTDLARFVW